MNCWHCNTELIWGSDFDGEDYGCEEEYSIVTNLTCPKCQSFLQVGLSISSKAYIYKKKFLTKTKRLKLISNHSMVASGTYYN